MRTLLVVIVVVALLVLGWLVLPWRLEAPAVAAEGEPARGEYVLRMAGCVTCHTKGDDGPFLAGGRAIESPYGTFYSSNITPDPATGIGGWSAGDFIVALTRGISPRGHPYYPAFPYTSYTRMTQQDLLDLKAYLDTVPPVRAEVPEHDLGFPANLRFLVRGWQLLFLDEGPFVARPDQDEVWNRGAYLVNGPGHCGECHTPRGPLGASDPDRHLAGQKKGPQHEKGVPNLRSGKDGLDGWSKTDITYMLQTGILPDGDVVGGDMGNVVDDETSHLEAADLEAIATYLMSLPPLDPQPGSQATGGAGEAASRAVLEDLPARGLTEPELVIGDGGNGLAALASGSGDVPVQRCSVHEERNLLAHAPDFPRMRPARHHPEQARRAGHPTGCGPRWPGKVILG